MNEQQHQFHVEEFKVLSDASQKIQETIHIITRFNMLSVAALSAWLLSDIPRVLPFGLAVVASWIPFVLALLFRIYYSSLINRMRIFVQYLKRLESSLAAPGFGYAHSPESKLPAVEIPFLGVRKMIFNMMVLLSLFLGVTLTLPLLNLQIGEIIMLLGIYLLRALWTSLTF